MDTHTTMRIILNGKAAENADIRDAVTRLRCSRVTIDVRLTWEAGDAAVFASEAADQEIDIVVAAGGDGTLNEVVGGMMASGLDKLPSLAVLPLGTANDFARGCEIPLDSPVDALKLALENEAVPIDVIDANDRKFLNMASCGFGSEVTASTSPELKKRIGGAAYFITWLRKLSELEPVEATIKGPDFDWEGRFNVLAIGNGRMAGGGMPLCPFAKLNDGLFDVCLLPFNEALVSVGAMFNPKNYTLDSMFIQKQMEWLEMEVAKPVQVNLDGEPTTTDKIRFAVEPKAINLHLPNTRMLDRVKSSIS